MILVLSRALRSRVVEDPAEEGCSDESDVTNGHVRRTIGLAGVIS